MPVYNIYKLYSKIVILKTVHSFDAEVDSEKYTSVLHGIIGGVPVPFPVNQGLISGPIKANSKIVYKNSLKVEQSYPKVINSPSKIISTLIYIKVHTGIFLFH